MPVCYVCANRCFQSDLVFWFSPLILSLGGVAGVWTRVPETPEEAEAQKQERDLPEQEGEAGVVGVYILLDGTATWG